MITDAAALALPLGNDPKSVLEHVRHKVILRYLYLSLSLLSNIP